MAGQRTSHRLQLKRRRASTASSRQTLPRGGPGSTRPKTSAQRTSFATSPSATSTPGVATLRASMQSASSPTQGTCCCRPAWTARSRSGTCSAAANACAPTSASPRCVLPVHSLLSHGLSQGVNAVRFFPDTGHLLLSAGLDGKVKVWDELGRGKCIRTYLGFTKVRCCHVACLQPAFTAVFLDPSQSHRGQGSSCCRHVNDCRYRPGM